MAVNLRRFDGIREHIREAQRLAQEEVHDSYEDRRIVRLSLGLHLCRELSDEIYEDVLAVQQEHGRPARDHY